MTVTYNPHMAYKNLPPKRPIKPSPTSGGTTVRAPQKPKPAPQGGGASGTGK